MSVSLEQLIEKYPEAHAWAFGDSAELADRLVTLVIAGKKMASCGSLHGWQDEESKPEPGGYSIILDGAGLRHPHHRPLFDSLRPRDAGDGDAGR